MIEFFREGGFSMFLVLLFGALTFIAAAAMVRKPEPGSVPMIRALSVATLFAVLSGVASNLSAVMHHVPNNPEWANDPQVHLIVMTGIGESLAPAILGFSLLALAWLLTAAGVRRLRASSTNGAMAV